MRSQWRWCGPPREECQRGHMVNKTGGLGVQRVSVHRRFTDHAVTVFAVIASAAIIAPLLAIFGYLVMKGIGSINWAFLTQTPKPVGEAGGGKGNGDGGGGVGLLVGLWGGNYVGGGGGEYFWGVGG